LSEREKKPKRVNTKKKGGSRYEAEKKKKENTWEGVDPRRGGSKTFGEGWNLGGTKKQKEKKRTKRPLAKKEKTRVTHELTLGHQGKRLGGYVKQGGNKGGEKEQQCWPH